MVRILNFFCVALMGLSILALYHVSEKTRVAHMRMNQVARQIAQEKAHIGVLQTEWQHVASPERIQQLAQSRLGMTDSASAQLSSFEQLPRRGADAPAPGNSSVHNASAQVPQASAMAPAAIPVSQTMSDPLNPGM
jgi:cell division protein FtsL